MLAKARCVSVGVMIVLTAHCFCELACASRWLRVRTAAVEAEPAPRAVEWSLYNPERKSLTELLSEQRRNMLTRIGRKNALFATGFISDDIGDPVTLNKEQIDVFIAAMMDKTGDVYLYDVRLLACTVLHLTFTMPAFVVLRLTRANLQETFINLESINVTEEDDA